MNRVADRHGFAVSLPAGRTRRPRQDVLERGLPLSGRYGRRRRAVPLRTDPAPSEKTWFEPPQRLLHGYVERRGTCVTCWPRAVRRPMRPSDRSPGSCPSKSSARTAIRIRFRCSKSTAPKTGRPAGKATSATKGLGRLCLLSRPRSATGPPRTNASQSGSTPCPPPRRL